MRQTLIAGNWKMNLNRAESLALARGIAQGSGSLSAELLVCPPFVYLDCVRGVLDGSSVRLGAQNVYHQPSGAFTGEISTSMLVDVGCRYVILGHSERRHVMGETDELIKAKVNAAMAAGLTPILCVGELLEEREAGRTEEVCQRQMNAVLDGMSEEQASGLVVAYEPVWAIGTGKTATPDQAQSVHADLRNLLTQRYNAGLSQSIRILYGGSVKPANAADLLAQPDIDGALVGGASLETSSFLAIAAAADTVSKT